MNPIRRVISTALLLSTLPVFAQTVVREPVAGVRNFARVETTIACAGAIDAATAVPEIKKLGFVSIINLREETEPGANVENERAVAEAAGLKYFHVPFNATTPDPKAADAFIAVITSLGVQPALVHCASGGRASAMWLIKRLVVDRWDVERATREATDLGQTSVTLRTFALDYASKYKP